MAVEFTPTAATTDAGGIPDKDAVWAETCSLLAQWIDRVTVRNTWSTDVGKSRSVAKKRVGLVDRPYRSMLVDLLALDAADVAGLDSILMRMAHARRRMPLYCDATELGEVAEVGATSLVCDTRWRRFYEDGYGLLVKPDLNGARSDSIRRIRFASVSPTGVTFVTPLADEYPAGSKLYPIIECELAHESSMRMVTSTVAEASLDVMEVAGPSSLPPLVDPGIDIGDATGDAYDFLIWLWSMTRHDTLLYEGYPVFPFNENIAWGEVERKIKRDGERVNVGRGSVTSIYGSRPAISLSMPMTFLSRESAWRLLQFFDWRGGMLLPFWVIDSVKSFEVTALMAASAEIVANIPELDWEFRPMLGFTYNDGTKAVRPVTHVGRVGNVDTVMWDEVLMDAGDVKSVSWAYLMAFSKDELLEGWLTDGAMATSIELEELIEEKTVTIANLESPATETDGLDRFQQDPSCCEG